MGDPDRVCGCKEGAVAALAALLVYLALLGCPVKPDWLQGPASWGVGAAFVITVSAVAKTAVILLARYRRHIRQVLPPAAGR